MRWLPGWGVQNLLCIVFPVCFSVSATHASDSQIAGDLLLLLHSGRRATILPPPVPSRPQLTKAGAFECCFNLSWHPGGRLARSELLKESVTGKYDQPVRYEIWGRMLDTVHGNAA